MSRENELFSLGHVPGCAFRKSRRASASAMKRARTGKNEAKRCASHSFQLFFPFFCRLFLSSVSICFSPVPAASLNQTNLGDQQVGKADITFPRHQNDANNLTELHWTHQQLKSPPSPQLKLHNKQRLLKTYFYER